MLKKLKQIKKKKTKSEPKNLNHLNENLKRLDDDNNRHEPEIDASHLSQNLDISKGFRLAGEDELIISAIDSTRPISFSSSLEKERADIEYISEKAKLSLDPMAHQNIIVMYSSACSKCAEPCHPPELQLIEYYLESDVTLGQYLEDLCFNENTTCSYKGCEHEQICHTRNYIHEGGGIKVSVKEMFCPNPGMEEIMLMWSACKLCQQSTPILPISDNTWKFSFGKYLELSYYLPNMACRADICPHIITRDHIRQFSWKNMLISIEYIPIQIFEISVPQLDLGIKSEAFVKLRQQDAESVRLQITAYFDSIAERIKKFTYEILPLSKLQTAKEAMNDFSKKCVIEKKFLLQLLQQTCVSTPPTDFIAINNVKKVLVEKTSEWDSDFNSFVRNYVQPETRDFRKITSVQLKKIFDVGKTDREPDDIQSFGENNYPLLGSSPKEIGSLHLNSLRYATFFSCKQMRLSIEFMGTIKKLENLIHLPVFGMSPTNETKISLKMRETIAFDNTEESKDELDFSKINLNDSSDFTEDHVVIGKEFVEINTSVRQLKHLSTLGEEEPIGWDNFTGVTVENDPIPDNSAQSLSLLPGERTSIMKTITNFWTGNQANLLPLEYPE